MNLTEQAIMCLARGDRAGWECAWNEFFTVNAMKSLAKGDWRDALDWALQIEPNATEARARIVRGWAKAKPWMVIDGHYIQSELDAWNKFTQGIIEWAKGEMACW